MLQTPRQISIRLQASPHQPFPFRVSKARVAMEIECLGNRISCWETVAQVERGGHWNSRSFMMPLFPFLKESPTSGKGTARSRKTLSLEFLRESKDFPLHTCHKDELVLALFIFPRKWPSRKALRGVSNRPLCSATNITCIR